MLKKIVCIISVAIMLLFAVGCGNEPHKPKLGVSFGVGGATRWVKEKQFMEERARELGADITVRLNTTDTPKTWREDCFELIDSGVDVLIMIPRDLRQVDDIVDYAKKKNVKVISYSRAILNPKTDLFIGYDTYKIGQNLGKHLSERVYKGNFIILKGDKGDFNTHFLYNGAYKYIEPMLGTNVNIILNDYVPGWSADTARAMVKQAVVANGMKLDAVLCPNDGLAGGAAAAVQELGLKNRVVIVGMDAELAAVKRLVDGTQDATVYMDLKNMASIAINQACVLAKGDKATANSEITNDSGEKIKAYLITGEMVTKENIDKVLLESGYYTKEQIYGQNKL